MRADSAYMKAIKYFIHVRMYMYVQLQTAMEQVSNQPGQLTVQLSVAAVTELEVAEDDVPGAALGCKLPDKLKVLVLK